MGQKAINNTLAEGLKVFSCFYAFGYRPASLARLRELTGLGEQKLRRILRTLEAEDLVVRDGEAWGISPRHLARHTAYLLDMDERLAAAKEIQRQAEAWAAEHTEKSAPARENLGGPSQC